jgi:hypothetical protein
MRERLGRSLIILGWSAWPVLSAAAVPGDPGAAETRALAESIVARAEAAAGRRFAAAFRGDAVGRLAALPPDELRERALGEGIGPLAPAGITPPPRLVYTPVPPCRILDTRQAGGVLPVGAPRDFRVTGVGLDIQGGNVNGCDVPFGPATSAIINFVAVNPVGAGNLRAWAYRTPPAAPPAASILNYTSGFNIANGIAVPLCDVSEAGQTCPADLRLQADVSGAHLVADVVGYFTREIPPTLVSAGSSGSTGLIFSTCTHVASATITVSAPGAGTVHVRGIALSLVNHTNGAEDRMLLGIMPQAANCAFTRITRSIVPAAAPTAAYETSVPLANVFSVPSAGDYTYYLNAVMSQGGEAGGGDQVIGGSTVTTLEATFFPSPPN